MPGKFAHFLPHQCQSNCKAKFCRCKKLAKTTLGGLCLQGKHDLAFCGEGVVGCIYDKMEDIVNDGPFNFADGWVTCSTAYDRVNTSSEHCGALM
jgi:hypothetical protein